MPSAFAAWVERTRGGDFPYKTLDTAPSCTKTNRTSCDRHGDGRPDDSHEKWQEAEAAFAKMLRQIRAEAGGGHTLMAGMQELFDRAQREESSWSSSYGCQAPEFEKLALNILRDEYLSLQDGGPQSIKLAKVLKQLKSYVDRTMKNLDPSCDWMAHELCTESAMEFARSFGAEEHPAFCGFVERRLQFVSLPLALYVRNTTVLYEMLNRMKALRMLEMPITANALRDNLDEDGWPYSILVFLVLCAFQALHVIQRGERHPGLLLQPLELSAPQDLGVPLDVYPDGSSRLIFRGIWVPWEIDDSLATWQWSFNSFSRDMCGVWWVLRYYAGCPGTEATKMATQHGHCFILVARRKSFGGWALPVQFFNEAGGRIEREVLVPPFIEYRFQEGVELCSDQSTSERQRRLVVLERRWGVRLEDEAPSLVMLLDGKGKDEVLGKSCGFKKVTVRFILQTELGAEMRRVLEDESLLEIPAKRAMP